MACVHGVSVRQLPSCSTAPRAGVQYQAFGISSRHARRQAARNFACSNRNDFSHVQHLRHAKARQKAAYRGLRIHSSRQDEAELREDFGLLSERLESLAEEVQKLLQGNSLYLVGMMGSGKSTVGRLVGKALKYPMLDTDQLIEETSKTTISEIFAQDGEEAFRDLESEVLHQLMPFTSCIVATGGGAVIRRKNWGYMQHAVVIWLDGAPELLASHVVGQPGGTKSRPLIFSNTDAVQEQALDEAEAQEAEMQQKHRNEEYTRTVEKLSKLLEERHAKYNDADIRIPLHVEEQKTVGAESAIIAYRVLKAVKERLLDTETKREEKRKFDIKGPDPKNVNVTQSTVSSDSTQDD